MVLALSGMGLASPSGILHYFNCSQFTFIWNVLGHLRGKILVAFFGLFLDMQT